MGSLTNSFFAREELGKGILSLSLLFALDADLLQSVMNVAMNNNLISKPLPGHSCPDFPVIQYVDGTLLLMPACTVQLEQLKNLLMHFTAYTGLRINF